MCQEGPVNFTFYRQVLDQDQEWGMKCEFLLIFLIYPMAEKGDILEIKVKKRHAVSTHIQKGWSFHPNVGSLILPVLIHLHPGRICWWGKHLVGECLMSAVTSTTVQYTYLLWRCYLLFQGSLWSVNTECIHLKSDIAAHF